MNFEKVFSRAFLVLVSVLLTLGAVEVGARIYLVHFAPEPVFKVYASLQQLEERYGNPANAARGKTLSRHHYLGHALTPDYVSGKNRHNALGFRGDEIAVPKPPGEFRIVCLGGSTTYTTQVEDYRLSYPALLETELHDAGLSNVKVINAGVPSWSTFESMLNFNLRVVDLDPDLVIVYHGVNDLLPRMVWPPEAYRSDNSGFLAPYWTEPVPPSPLEYSTAARILMIRLGWATTQNSSTYVVLGRSHTFVGPLVVEISDPRRTAFARPGETISQTVGRVLAANPPRYFVRNIGNIIALARSRGSEVLLATFAAGDYVPRYDSFATAFYEAIGAQNAAMHRLADSTGVRYFDFASVFPRSQDYFVDGIHVTEKGSREKARLFANFILDNQLIPRP